MAFNETEEGVTSMRVGTGVGGGGGGAGGSGAVGLSLPQAASNGRPMARKMVNARRRRLPHQARATSTPGEEDCFDRLDGLEETADLRSLLVWMIISYR